MAEAIKHLVFIGEQPQIFKRFSNDQATNFDLHYLESTKDTLVFLDTQLDNFQNFSFFFLIIDIKFPELEELLNSVRNQIQAKKALHNGFIVQHHIFIPAVDLVQEKTLKEHFNLVLSLPNKAINRIFINSIDLNVFLSVADNFLKQDIRYI